VHCKPFFAHTRTQLISPAVLLKLLLFGLAVPRENIGLSDQPIIIRPDALHIIQCTVTKHTERNAKHNDVGGAF